MTQALLYTHHERGGYITYQDKDGTIKLFFEFGGKNCLAIIYIPTIHEWPSKTNRPLADRIPILTYIAEQVIKDKAPNSFYKLSDTHIEIITNIAI